MKRREILCLLAGCILFLSPMQARAATLPDLLGIGSINVTEDVQEDTEASEEDTNESSASAADTDGEAGSAGNVSDNGVEGGSKGQTGEDSSKDRSISDNGVEGSEGEEDASEDQTEAETGTDAGKKESDASLQDILGGTIGSSAILEFTKTEQEYAEAYEKAKNANWGYTNLGIANVDNNLNIRAVAAEDGKLVGKLPKDAACEVLDSDDTWAHIKSGKVEGYVSLEYLLTGIPAKRRAEELAATMARVTADGLKVRAEANTESEVVTQVPMGEELEVVSVEGDWVKVYLDADEVFVSADYVEVSSELGTAITMTELFYGQGVSDVRVDVCQYAKEFLGNPYVWGGTSLTKGADCSGFVLSVFKKYGVSLPHSSVAQSKLGTAIKVSEAKPGDLIFYGNGKSINHVAIYIGSGQVIHASNPKTGIRISNTSYRSPVKAVRILHD